MKCAKVACLTLELTFAIWTPNQKATICSTLRHLLWKGTPLWKSKKCAKVTGWMNWCVQ